jgi:hypothetical protein
MNPLVSNLNPYSPKSQRITKTIELKSKKYKTSRSNDDRIKNGYPRVSIKVPIGE